VGEEKWTWHACGCIAQAKLPKTLKELMDMVWTVGTVKLCIKIEQGEYFKG